MTELPPLPYPHIPGNDYTAADMRAYAEAAVKAERAACEETCAKLWDLRDDERARMYAAKCAAAIRARGE